MTASHSLLVTRHSLRLTPRRELALIVTLLLLAFFFRTYELTGLGLGLEHDEVAEWQIADSIRHGRNALFFKEAYGQEPLFLYLMAGSITLMGDNVLAIRFTSVVVAMLMLAASYRLLRRMFSPTVALVALASMSIALWPVFWGRVGLRAMMLPLMLALGFDWLWRGLIKDEGGRMKDEGRSRPFILAGIFLGLSAYTYLSSRALPILLAIFTLYLALFARKKMQGKWRGLFVCFIVAGAIVLPLVITLFAQPDLQFRVSEVSGPLDKALQGDWSDVNANVGRALGMFTVQGDTTVRDNWPNRPVFPEAIGQWLFLGGVIVAFTRFRQPRYVLALLWIGVMLIPTVFSTGAPNFTRTLGALSMVFAMPGIAVEAVVFWAPRLFPLQYYQSISRVTNVLIVSGLVAVLGINAASTFEDYFIQWPQHSETQFVFQADFAAIAKDIDASDVMDVSVGGLSNDTMDDPSLYLLRKRKDVRVRWFNSADKPTSSGGAVLLPFNYGLGLTYIPSIVPMSSALKQAWAWWITDSIQEPHYTRFRTDVVAGYFSPDIFYTARHFDGMGTLVLQGMELPKEVKVGTDLQFTTQWAELERTTSLWRIFVHLVDPAIGKPIAQYDGLDSPSRFWPGGDWLYQHHHIAIPPDIPPGHYELWLGVYDPETGVRAMQTEQWGTEPPSDHYVLGTIEVTR